MICFGLLFTRFLWLQWYKHDQYSAKAEDNRISVAPIEPNRGIIMDRNGVILARNYSAYTLEITPSKLTDTLDNTIESLSSLVDIQPRDRRRFKRLLEESRSFESLPIRSQLSDEEVAKFSAQRFRFPGVDVRARLFRQYPLGESASHVIGYLGRISQRDQERIDAMDEANDAEGAKYDPRKDADNYKGTNYIGKIGLEQSYEAELHGLTGFEEVEVSAGGRPIRTLSTSPATPGNNLILSLDIRSSNWPSSCSATGAARWWRSSRPRATSWPSSPSRPTTRTCSWKASTRRPGTNSTARPDKPLLNRPLRGTLSARLHLQAVHGAGGADHRQAHGRLGHARSGLLHAGQPHLPRRQAGRPRLGGHAGVHRAVLRHLLLRAGARHGRQRHPRLHEAARVRPDHGYRHRGREPRHPAVHRVEAQGVPQARAAAWYDGETISLGIGQGYNSFTILQLANAVSIIVNNGAVMKPHLVKAVEDSVSRQRTLTVPKESYRIPLKQADIDVIKKAMVAVTHSGTAARVFAGAAYESAGKTGTAQTYTLAKGEKYNHHAIDERKRDHSLYTAFAPADNPKIALALIVENAGFGAAVAAPIARKVMDYYLLGKWPEELQANAPPPAERERAGGKPPVDTPSVFTTGLTARRRRRPR